MPNLIGRQRETTLLQEQLAAAARGHLRVVFVSGAPGIGKTCLLEQLAAHAGQTSARVLRGSASEAEGMPPYLPFLEALGHYIQTVELEQLRAQSETVAPILATILPELTLRFGEIKTGYALPPEQARLRLYEAVGAFLAAIAQAAPLVLILDDLHWADHATLDLLCYVARHQLQTRLFLVGSYREGEVADHSGFQRAMAELTRLRLLTTIPMRPLAETEVQQLALHILGGPVAPTVTHRLYQQSEGNPFFVEELLHGWLEANALVQTGQQWTLQGAVEHLLPASLVGAIRQRLARLTPPVLNTLRTAALIGRTFAIELLAAVLGQDEESVEEQLRDPMRIHVVEATPNGLYTFSHDKIRECLSSEVTPTRRKRLHGLIGQALEDSAAPPAGAHQLAELAFHFTRSGDRTRGIQYAQQAAEQALSTYAFDEALRHYRTILDLLEPHDPQRGMLLLQLGQTALLASDHSAAVNAFETAHVHFLQKHDPVAAARAAHGLGKARWQQEMILPAKLAFETSANLLAKRILPETVEVLVDLSSLLTLSLHQQTAGLAYARQALELAEHLEEDRLMASASRALGNLLVRANDLPAGIALLEKALDLAMPIDDPAEAGECCAGLVMACAWHGEFQRAEMYARRQINFGQRCHAPHLLRHVYTLLAQFYAFRGQMDETRRLLATAEALLAQLANPEALAFLDFSRGGFAWIEGDYAQSEQLFAKAITVFRTLGPETIVWYLGFLGMVQALQGKRQAALACMDEVETLMAKMPAGAMPTAEPLAQMSMIALLLADQERLRRLYPQLIVFRGQFHDAAVDRLLGEMETRRGDFAAAQRSLAAAEALTRRENSLWELAHVLVAQANLEAAQQKGQERSARIQALLSEALRLFDGFGNQTEAQRLRDRLNQMASQPAEPVRPTYPAGLSEREVEVLRLVAAGKSNREIAETLVLSEKTVANHLTHIFNKTTTDNRAAATAFAIRNGLV
ncbi:MAG: AAA family ATPase [Caldilineaceae bacterium]